MAIPFDVIKPTAAGLVPPASAPLKLDLEPVDATAPFGPYVISPDLATSINVALALNQPLLVTGEPGCGKTSLAWAVSRQLGTQVYEFHTKSTSTAKDLLYTVDTLRRFHDASAGAAEAHDVSRYIQYQALGRAIMSDGTIVVLIDEIDKAPRDFPNDLLNEIDRMRFTVDELTPPVTWESKVRHFVLITSNSERRLPLPFLRRCVYTHIEFPDEDALNRIVTLHTEKLSLSKSFVACAVRRFLEIRRIGQLGKPPATGELITWVRVIHRMGISESQLDKLAPDRLPALETMIKLLDDWKIIKEKEAP